MGIRSEWDRLMKVVIHRPGPEIEYAMLSPRSFLFERPFSTSLARKEHLLMEDTLKGEGIEVIQLRDIFIDMAEHDSDFRKELEKKVENTVMFFGERDTVSSARDDFSRNLHELDPETLFAMMTLEPSLDLRRNTEGDLNYPTIYSNVPLANLYFMRDQQAVLTDGVAIGRMRNVQRRKEINITRFLIERALKIRNTYKVTADGFLEGGDYMPMGKFAIFGTGSRTNMEGVRQVLQSGLIDFDRVYVVQNPVYDFMEVDNNPMINMHLDTYFNVPSSGTVISNRDLCERSKGVIFSRTDAGYEETGETTLMNIIKEEGMNLIDLSIPEQMSYASNFLTVREGRIIAVETGKVLKRLMQRGVFSENTTRIISHEVSRTGTETMFPNGSKLRDHGIDWISMDLQELTGGYGGAHCMTASIERS